MQNINHNVISLSLVLCCVVLCCVVLCCVVLCCVVLCCVVLCCVVLCCVVLLSEEASYRCMIVGIRFCFSNICLPWMSDCPSQWGFL